MTDKEVGELWLKHKLPVVGELIRKLVEERNCRRISCKIFEEHTHPFGSRPLVDYGIPEETWK